MPPISQQFPSICLLLSFSLYALSLSMLDNQGTEIYKTTQNQTKTEEQKIMLFFRPFRKM